ncbi:hypothetical protein ACSBR1_004875 [Camellia fascicularis]
MEAGGGRPKQRIHEAAVEGGGRQEQRLHKAAVAGDEDTLTEILDGDPNILDMVKKSPGLIEVLDSRRWSPLHLASARGHKDIVQALLMKMLEPLSIILQP